MHILIFILFLLSSVYAYDYIDATSSEMQVLQKDYLLLEDKTASLQFEDIILERFQKDFKKLNGASNGFGLSKSFFWIKIPLHNPSKETLERLLYFEYPLLDTVTLYTKNADGSYSKVVNGDQIPISLHVRNDVNIIFPLILQPQSKQDYYIQVCSKSSMDLRLLLVSDLEYYKKVETNNTITGLFYGAIFIMILYNLFLFLSIRERAYLYYVLFHMTSFLSLFSLRGMSFKYLWQEHPFLNNYLIPFQMILVYILAIVFSRVFLNTKNNLPKEDKILQFLLYFYFPALLCTLLFDYRIGLYIALIVLLSTIITLPIIGLLAFFKYKVREARYYLIAWLLMLLLNLFVLFQKTGFLPNAFLTDWSLEISVVVELLLLSFALADRFNIMRNEKEEFHKVALEKTDALAKMLLRSKEELEVKVEERTHELNVANENLKDSLQTVKLLFKELHHRVKNNIQVTISMMQLQKKRAKEKAVHIIIDDNTMRLQSIALIHELLYKDNDISMVNIEKYIFAFLATYKKNEQDHEVLVKKNIGSFELNMDDAITVGLIFNEILTNIYKHAFVQTNGNQLMIRCEKKNNLVTLAIKDNGIGFDKKTSHKESLGLLLIDDLALKLTNAKTYHKKWYGTYFKLEFTSENNHFDS